MKGILLLLIVAVQTDKARHIVIELSHSSHLICALTTRIARLCHGSVFLALILCRCFGWIVVIRLVVIILIFIVIVIFFRVFAIPEQSRTIDESLRLLIDAIHISVFFEETSADEREH